MTYIYLLLFYCVAFSLKTLYLYTKFLDFFGSVSVRPVRYTSDGVLDGNGFAFFSLRFGLGCCPLRKLGHFDVDILQTVPGVCRITFLKVLDERRPSRQFLFCQFLWKKRMIQRPTRGVLVWCNMIIFSSGSLVSLKPLVTLLDFFY